MKKLMFVILLSNFNSVIVYSQNQPFPPEMWLIVVNATTCQNYHTFSFSKISKSYCYNSEFSDILECGNILDAAFYGCDGGSYDLYIDEECENLYGNVGGGFCNQEGAFTSAVYGYGVYKFSDETTGHYVYIDFRDARSTRENLNYPSGCTYEGYHDDFHLLYDGTGFFSLDGADDGNYELTVPSGGLIQIWKGIWDINCGGQTTYKTFITPEVESFPQEGEDDFWTNCLAIDFPPEYIATPFPLQAIWSKNPNQSNISKYFLYRQIDSGGYIKIGEFNNQTFDYKDKSILFTGDGSSTVSYKVTSFNGIEST